MEATSAQPAASKPTATAVKKTRLTLLNGKNGKSTKSSSSQTEAGDAATNEVADNGEPVHSAKKRRKRRKNNQVGRPATRPPHSTRNVSPKLIYRCQAQPIVPPLDNEQPSTPSAAADVRDGVEGGVSTEKKKRKGGRKPKSAVSLLFLHLLISRDFFF